ncbi:hypothetical protein [Geodermatophilus saharensis]|uniref:hypothetical protein n=1 Tax=Geodermatophilus saharensis TaxID=1137994 RepID=UPI000B77E066|nr:hypothetical protein [Geodermatophilus saharensis]
MAQEYSAVRNDVQVALAGQISILSFGAAAVGLLAAAAAELWDRVPWLSVGILALAIPVVCLLALAIYAGEQVRQMRAGAFLNDLETYVYWAAGGSVLVFEHWDVRRGSLDVDRYSRRAIVVIFSLLSVGFATAGYIRLFSGYPIKISTAVLLLLASWALFAVFVLWIRRLFAIAAGYRALYDL